MWLIKACACAEALVDSWSHAQTYLQAGGSTTHQSLAAHAKLAVSLARTELLVELAGQFCRAVCWTSNSTARLWRSCHLTKDCRQHGPVHSPARSGWAPPALAGTSCTSWGPLPSTVGMPQHHALRKSPNGAGTGSKTQVALIVAPLAA